MKPFRTPLPITPSTQFIGLQHQVLTLGSCFAEAIGTQLHQHKINTLINPFGTLYSPLAIHKVLRYAIFNEPVPPHTYLMQQDVYLNYDFHSALSDLNRPALEKKLTETIGTVHHFLRSADTLLITYGTSWIYERLETGEPVANCHKRPTSEFNKILLTQKKILESFDQVYQELMQFNKNLRIIITVSPVRHIKDTIELNSVSKSILRIACHTLQQNYLQVEYFPAYEIMMDDLRDYRFYKEDMIHPSSEAEQYIWNHFYERYGDSQLKEFIPRWKKIKDSLNHRAFHPEGKAHQQFLRNLLIQLNELKSLVPVDAEIELVEKQLVKEF